EHVQAVGGEQVAVQVDRGAREGLDGGGAEVVDVVGDDGVGDGGGGGPDLGDGEDALALEVLGGVAEVVVGDGALDDGGVGAVEGDAGAAAAALLAGALAEVGVVAGDHAVEEVDRVRGLAGQGDAGDGAPRGGGLEAGAVAALRGVGDEEGLVGGDVGAGG